jgi:hypothetical protein
VGSRKPPLLRRVSSGDVRSLEDRECASPLLSLKASALVGDLSVLGMASSSMVRPRDFGGVVVSVRLRIVMPWRCLSLRFWNHQYCNATMSAHLRMEAATGAHVVETWAARLPGKLLQPCYVADRQEWGVVEPRLIRSFWEETPSA